MKNSLSATSLVPAAGFTPAFSLRSRVAPPTPLLPADHGDVLEVAVVVQNHALVVLGDCRSEQVDDPCGAVLTEAGEHCLHSPGPHTDLRKQWQIRKAGRTTACGCRIRGGVARGVPDFQVDGDTGRQEPQPTQSSCTTDDASTSASGSA